MDIPVNRLIRSVLLAAILYSTLLEANGGRASSCSDEEFRCLNGRCIDRELFCDGSRHCSDDSDENYCSISRYNTCPTGWYSCPQDANTERCYPREFKCNGWTDCPDGSDEMNCGNFIQSVMGAIRAQRKLVRLFMGTRQSSNLINKWDHYLPRIATALFLFDGELMSPFNETGQEMIYELSLQLLKKLTLDDGIHSHDLALYINSLIIFCMNPRDFFGIDMVGKLRHRVTAENYTNPFTILTLCNARDNMTSEDVNKVLTAFDGHYRPVWTDVQALATMALACMWNQRNLAVDIEKLKMMTDELKMKQQRNGTVDNLKTTALVVQALLATESYKENFNLETAVKSIVQMLASESTFNADFYYVLPLFGFKSLVNINDHHCKLPKKTDVELFMNVEEDIQVQCSVIIGHKMSFVRTWKLKVPVNHTFYQVLEMIGSKEPQYKARYDMSKGKPYVTGVSKLVDDAGRGAYWFIYSKALGSTDNPKLINQSPVDIQVNDKEELILWYKSGNWADSL